MSTSLGDVPRVKTRLDRRDFWGAVRVRSNIGRTSYTVKPGLYAVGDPGESAAVLVSANYKLSFDTLRSMLTGRSAWILVLDTRGINVWCAAGKGTFGTDELVGRVQACGLDRIVSHRRLVVPQLGAPGVSAPEVRKRCGFRVEYGPVRAQDLPAFLDAGMKATEAMRRVRFGLRDRVVLVPVELSMGARRILTVAAALAIAGGLSQSGYSLSSVRSAGLPAAALALGAFLCGTILGPALLPWLPGRAFSIKGAVLGLAAVGLVAASGAKVGPSWLAAGGLALIVPAISSFALMNFTGASTFTSQSGVLHEMRRAVPVQLAASVIGLALWLTGLLLPGGR